MKILILADGIPPHSKGGAETVAWNAARALAQAGEDVHLITTVRDRAGEGVTRREGVAVYAIYSSYHERWRAYLSLYNPQTVSKVRKYIVEIKPDVVHAHNIHHHLSYHCLKVAKKSGTKVFLTAHDVMLFHYGKLSGLEPIKISPWRQLKKYKWRYNPFRNMVIKRYVGYADTIFAVSEALKAALEQNGIRKVSVFHNGIAVDEWGALPQEVEAFKSKHGLHGKKVIFFGGRIAKIKGGDQALSALEMVRKEFPEAVLMVAGEENEYTKSLPADNLVCTGWLSGNELKAAYQASDLVLMPSICFDTFGMVCLEAMASRKPVIATPFGGPREVVLDGETGYIVNPFETKLLAGKMTDLLSHPEKAQAFGEKGFERVKACFDLKTQMSVYLQKCI